MKKYILVFLLISCLFSCSNARYEYNLEEMGKAVKRHIEYQDIEDNTVTTISYFKPVSYEEVSESKRPVQEAKYIVKIFIEGKWSYINSYRIYNINDTLSYYFDNNMQFLQAAKE